MDKQSLSSQWQQWRRITPQNALYDRALFWLFIVLLLIGLVAVTSASIPVSTRLYNDPFHFAKRDVLYVLFSVMMFFVATMVPSHLWGKYYGHLFLLTLFLLILVNIPGVGLSVNGAQRWLGFRSVNFQPAELAKLTLPCFLASYFTRKYDEARSKKLSAVKPLCVTFLLGFCLLWQPDLGSTVVLFVITFGLLFIVGASLSQFLWLLLLGIVLLAIAIANSSYRFARFAGFLDPFADPYGKGFQLTNSLMAFGRGQMNGEGLGNSIQKLEYLPEAHTDFVLAVVGEEFGFIGVMVIIALLALFVFRVMKIARESLQLEQRFRGFFAFGIGFWLFFQGFVNLGMAMGMLPTKGLTFPLISYGGSSLVIVSISVGVLMRIDHENRLAKLGQARLYDD